MNPTNTAVSAAILLSLSCFTPPAAAIYKCEQAGVITYTDVPCDGQQLSMTVPERPREAEGGTDDKSIERGKKRSRKIADYTRAARTAG